MSCFCPYCKQGYDTLLEGKGGNELTVVQRVRLSIARAIFRDPHFLLVDNVTGGLDSREAKASLGSEAPSVDLPLLI